MQENKRGNGVCPTCGRMKKRSNPQNNRLHQLFTLIAANLKAADGLYHHHLWWKVQFKDRWLAYEETPRSDGTMIYRMRSTAELDVDEFNDFMTQVEAWAAENGVWLEE